ncbi:MAG: 50S ribosomal protein L24 [Chloroflexi bacterium]|nr:50S ribosomal protein L24 [Chloroflexota bacterium]MCL5275637.1 50S ribosomal protein L24 [Chloroflexota bacterium]
MKVKKGDTVQILTGNDRGKRGEIIKVLPKANQVIVRGMNIAKKHAKANQGQNLRATQTGLIDVEMPIDASNVALVTPSGKPTRVSFIDESGERKRYSNKYDEVLD